MGGRISTTRCICACILRTRLFDSTTLGCFQSPKLRRRKHKQHLQSTEYGVQCTQCTTMEVLKQPWKRLEYMCVYSVDQNTRMIRQSHQAHQAYPAHQAYQSHQSHQAHQIHTQLWKRRALLGNYTHYYKEMAQKGNKHLGISVFYSFVHSLISRTLYSFFPSLPLSG